MPWNRLTPEQVAERLAETTNLPLDSVKSLLRAQAQLAYDHAALGVTIPGIGTLKKKERPERRGKNPRTGELIIIPAKTTTKFRLSRLANDMIANPSQPLPDIFQVPDIPEVTFSTAAPELREDSPLITGLGTSVTDGFIRLPDVHLPTGRICAADPLLLAEATPFVQSVAPGRYPLLLAQAKNLIALAILRFSDKPVVRWEVASNGTEREGYGVDSATGSFCDEAFVRALDAAEDLAGEFTERLVAELVDASRGGREWTFADSPSGSLATFCSGSSDGFYTSWFGLDQNNTPAALVTDFRVIPWPPTEH